MCPNNSKVILVKLWLSTTVPITSERFGNGNKWEIDHMFLEEFLSILIHSTLLITTHAAKNVKMKFNIKIGL